MRILLFHPRGRLVDRNDIHTLACVMPPVGLASIAAVLRTAGHDVAILDAALDPGIPNDAWARRIVDFHPDLVGFSAVTPGFHDAYDVCARVKNLNADIRTVFGGVHVSWGKERILRDFPAIDCLVAGEGEYAMRDLATGVEYAKIEGLYFRDCAQIKDGPHRTTQCVMDDLPFPAYDLLTGFPRQYQMPLFGYRHHPGANIISSRGCVYQCTYCDRSVFGKSFRWNSPEYTFEQVKWLRKNFGVRHVNFYDDLFTLNRARVERLCTLLADARLGVSFNCIVRIGHIDEELIRLLKSGGCWMVNVGIESGDQAILDANKDGLSLDDIHRDVKRLHDEGLWVKGLFMMGFPGETEASIVKTRELALSLPLKDANITAFTPFPGAPITEKIREYGEFDEDWAKMDCEHFVFVSKEIGSRERLEELRRRFIRGFYESRGMRKVYRRMLWESPHSYWRLLRHAGQFLRARKSYEE